MRLKQFSLAVLGLIFTSLNCVGQVVIDPNDSAILRARANLTNVERLVTSGVLPSFRLDQAKDNLIDARDIAILHQTLYGKELTIDQTDEMIAAAQRRVDRKLRVQAEMQKLLNQEKISNAEMTTYK